MGNDKGNRISALRSRRKLKERNDTPRWPEDGFIMEESGPSQPMITETLNIESNDGNQSDSSENHHQHAGSTIYRPPAESTDIESNNLESSGEPNYNDDDDDDGDVEAKTKTIRSKNSMLCNSQRANASQSRLIGRRRRLIYQRRCNKSNFDNDHDGDIDNDDDDDSDIDDNESDSIDDNNNISNESTEDLIADAIISANASITGSGTSAIKSQDKPVSFLRSRMVHQHSKQQQSSKSTVALEDNDNPLADERQQGSNSSRTGPLCQENGSGIGQTLAALVSKSFSLVLPTKPQNQNSDKIRDIELIDREQQSFQKQADSNMPGATRYQLIQGYNGPESRRKSSIKQKFTETQYSKPKGYSELGSYAHLITDKNESIFQVLKRLLLLLFIICISCLLLWKLYENLTEEFNYLGAVESPSIQPEYHSYAVSTDAKPCAKVGTEILARGGSAVDAAIGTLICMSVAIPNSMGIGGGCFMTLYDAKKRESIAIDGREVAPDYAKEDMFVNDSLAASRGPLSVGVPGELAAYWKAHQMYGKLPWAELFNRSIDMAEHGIPMVEHLATALRTKSHAKYITPLMAKIFSNSSTGEYLNQGDLLVQKQYAETLKRIRDNGVKEFYEGQTGQLFIEDLKKQGGRITIEDLSKYEARVKKTLLLKLTDDLNLHTQPIPASGHVLSIILRVMKELGYYKARPQTSLADAALYYHRLMEAYKFAYAQRAALEDKPDDPERLSQLLAKLESVAFIKEVASKIDNKTHDFEYYGAKQYFQEDHGTAHVSVLDSEGNAAAVTTSVNLYFGSGLISPSTGIVYNDIMDDFVSPKMINKFGLAPSNYNRIRPGRRPLSSMAPSVITDSQGNVRLVIGASGGSMITTSIATVSLRHLYLGEDIKTAVDGPRIHHQLLPDNIMHEHNFPKVMMHLLSHQYGHQLEAIKGRSSVVMAVAANYCPQTNVTRCRKITANSDHRKGGSVDGL